MRTFALVCLLALAGCSSSPIKRPPAQGADRCFLGQLTGVQRGALSATLMTVTDRNGAQRHLTSEERAQLECKRADLRQVLAGIALPAELIIAY